MTQKLILTIGLPKSGKSTWARNKAECNHSYVIICRNDIRKMLSPVPNFTNARESLVTVIETNAVRSAIGKNLNVIIDSHHLNPKIIDKWMDYVEKENALRVEKNLEPIEIETVWFNTSLEECIRRDENSPEHLQTGTNLIRSIHNKYFASVDTSSFTRVVDNSWWDKNKPLPSNPTENDMVW